MLYIQWHSFWIGYMVKQLKPKKGPIMFFKNIQLAKNPFFKTLNLDRHSSLSFLTSRTTNKDIMPSGRTSAELVMDAMLNGLAAEIKKTVLAPTYRKSSDGKWVNPEEMTLVLKRVKELEKGKISPETAKALWDYFLLYKFGNGLLQF